MMMMMIQCESKHGAIESEILVEIELCLTDACSFILYVCMCVFFFNIFIGMLHYIIISNTTCYLQLVMYVCMYICIYVYVCMYVCTYVCMYVRTYVCMYVCMYICT